MLNLFLVSVVVVSWYHMNPKVIKVDLDHIKAMTSADALTGSVLSLMGFRVTAPVGDRKTFCQWVKDEKGELNPPFDNLDCTAKNSLSLHDFAAHGMYKGDPYKNYTVWDVYARGTKNNDGQLYEDGHTDWTLPTGSVADTYMENYGIMAGPYECSHKYLKWVRDLQMALAIILFLYLVAHIVHFAVYETSTTASQSMKMAVDWTVLLLSVVCYIFVIIVFFVERRSPIFTKCGWITQWFQTEMFMLYGVTMTYLILGFVGIFICILHVIMVMYKKTEQQGGNFPGSNFLYNAVVGDALGI